MKSILYPIKSYKMSFEYSNLFIIKHAQKNKILTRIFESKRKIQFQALEKIGTILASNLIKQNIKITRIINIPRAGLPISKAVSNILDIRFENSNQGKYKNSSSKVFFKKLKHQDKILICDSIIDQGHTITTLMENLLKRKTPFHACIICAFITPDGAYRLQQQYPDVKIFAFEIIQNTTWQRNGDNEFYRMLANLPDIGDIVERFNKCEF